MRRAPPTTTIVLPDSGGDVESQAEGVDSAPALTARAVRPPRQPARWLVRSVACLITIAAVAATTGLVVLRGSSQAGPAVPGSPVAAPVERRTVQDVVLTRGTVGGRPLGTVLSSGSGRVTGIPVQAGSVVTAGLKVLEIDGSAVIAVPGVFPFWRELREGMTGRDVRQMKAFLRSEKLRPGSDDETFSPQATAALLAWQKTHELPADGVLRPTVVLAGQWPARAQTLKVALGDFVSPGTPLVDLTGTDSVVNLELTPADRGRLQPGLPVSVTIPDLPQNVRGTLAEVSPVPTKSTDPNQTKETFAARVALPADAAPPVNGTAVRVRIVIREAKDVPVVPVVAIRTEGTGQPAVLVRSAGSQQVRTVVTGVQEGAFVEVRSGLAVGELVVLDLG